jgi:hypothetical protein
MLSPERRTGTVQTFHAAAETFPMDKDAPTQTMYLILYPESQKEEVVELLDSVGVPGFTETEKVLGRGRRGRHFDNSIWPGADGMIYAVVGPTHSKALAAALATYSHSLELRSRGLTGLHVFTWPCDQLF